MPGTSVIPLFGPVLPGKGIPRSRPRGLVWATSGAARISPIRIAIGILITIFLFDVVGLLLYELCRSSQVLTGNFAPFDFSLTLLIPGINGDLSSRKRTELELRDRPSRCAYD